MAKISPIKGFRPSSEQAKAVASPPYDVLNSAEAKAMADGNPMSFLRIIKPEIELDDALSPYSDEVYLQAKNNFKRFVEEAYLIPDPQACMYLYRQIMGDHHQVGLVCGSSIDDYFEDVIKKHEYTRPTKERDRIRHIMTSGIHAGPVFSAYKHQPEIDAMVDEIVVKTKPHTHFTADDGIQHSIWVVKDQVWLDKMTQLFADKVPFTYIADGHHRAASTSKVGRMHQDVDKVKGVYTGKEKYNHFLSVLFPDNQLSIIDYNRVVKDLNGLSKKEFITALAQYFSIEVVSREKGKPHEGHPHCFGMFLDDEWFHLHLKKEFWEDEDPVESLDVALLQKYLLEPILGIKDQRTDERIDFVGGIRGMKELEKRVNSGDMAVAFAIQAVTMAQLFAVADSGEVMPPKSTWFEPKLRSGLVVYPYLGSL